ncbi:uridine phosphorylase domain protein, partial [Vibrio parahaemolyticus V-223/04]
MLVQGSLQCSCTQQLTNELIVYKISHNKERHMSQAVFH